MLVYRETLRLITEFAGNNISFDMVTAPWLKKFHAPHELLTASKRLIIEQPYVPVKIHFPYVQINFSQWGTENIVLKS
jgi:hypothetical protein